MNDTVNGADSLSAAAHFIEAILCDERGYTSARELVRLRLAASGAGDTAVAESKLREAAAFSDTLNGQHWRDAMRSHFELAEFLLANGKHADCAAALSLVLGIIKHYFSPGNRAMAQMHRVRAFCLRKSGCLLGAERDEQFAAFMERGGRR